MEEASIDVRSIRIKNISWEPIDSSIVCICMVTRGCGSIREHSPASTKKDSEKKKKKSSACIVNKERDIRMVTDD